MTFSAWHTVVNMIKHCRNFRNPEDANVGFCNPSPEKGVDQLSWFDPVDRPRRILAHDIENNVPFFAVALLYVVTDAGNSVPLYCYTVSKFAHHIIQGLGFSHEIRAPVWTFTNLSFLYMSWKVAPHILY
eukprot:Awhi_evm1s1851